MDIVRRPLDHPFRSIASAMVMAIAAGAQHAQAAAPPWVTARFPAEGVPCRGNSANDIMVQVGNLCVDKYEASVWSNWDATGTRFPQSVPRYPDTFPVTGNWTVPLYAASVAGVFPSTFLTWFQAQQACALSGKRLLTNAEWQMAAAGTPDPGFNGNGVTECNTNTSGPNRTGTSGNCVSKWGVHDMVGNVDEWVADWIQGPGTAASNNQYVTNDWMPQAWATSSNAYGNDDIVSINNAAHDESPQTGQPPTPPTSMPAALSRGGLWNENVGAGVFTLSAAHTPSSLNNAIGFRCAR